MTEVLIVSNWVPGRPSVLADTVAQLHADGVRVTIAVGCPADRITVPDGTAEVLALPVAKRLSPADRSEYTNAVKSRKLWLRARNDARMRSRAGSADVIVALDPNAVHTVWQLARRHRAADAVVGLAPARAALAKRAADPSRYATRRVLRRGPHPAVAMDAVRERVDRLTEKVVRRGSGPRVLGDPRGRRAWRTLLRAPGLNDTRRLLWGERIAERLLTMDRPADASAVRAAAAHRMREPVTRAEWLGAAATAELEAGRVPAFLSEAAAAELVRADLALARNNLIEATRSVARTFPFLFNRAVHFDSMTSPMAQDPAGFLAPLHDSLAGRTIAAPRGRRTPAAPPPTHRPHRLLFVTRANEYFLGDIRERYASTPGSRYAASTCSPTKSGNR